MGRSFYSARYQIETCSVLLTPSADPKEFLSTVVKCFIPDDASRELSTSTSTPASTQVSTSPTNNNKSLSFPRALSLTVQPLDDLADFSDHALHDTSNTDSQTFATKAITKSKDHHKYAASLRTELDFLLNCGVVMSATLDDAREHRV